METGKNKNKKEYTKMLTLIFLSSGITGDFCFLHYTFIF